MTAPGESGRWAPALCGRFIKFGSLATIAACRLRVWGAAYAGAKIILRSRSRIGNDRYWPEAAGRKISFPAIRVTAF